MEDKAAMDEPRIYEIRMEGHLADHWSNWFEGLAICHDQSATVLTGLLNDQAALYGVLGKIHNLNLVLVSVIRLPSQARAEE